MKKVIEPFVGITGFMTRLEVEEILDIADSVEIGRKIMIGVLVSNTTLAGGSSKHSNRYPSIANVATIFSKRNNALNLIHYYTKDRDRFIDDLAKMDEIVGESLHGYQLNIAWPSPSKLEKYRLQNPDKIIVLQVGPKALQMVSHSPQKLGEKIAKEYTGLFDYLMIDGSDGQGVELDYVVTLEYMREVASRISDIRYVVVGGLSGTNVELILPIKKEFRNISWDAEKRLQDEHGKLDKFLMLYYIFTSSRLLTCYIPKKS